MNLNVDVAAAFFFIKWLYFIPQGKQKHEHPFIACVKRLSIVLRVRKTKLRTILSRF